MKFYDIYGAFAYRASNRCHTLRLFDLSLILPKDSGNVVYRMKSGKLAFFFKRCYVDEREWTLLVIVIAPLICLLSGLHHRDQTMSLESHLSANFVEKLYEIEERREKLLLCDVGYSSNVINVMMPSESVEEILIEW